MVDPELVAAIEFLPPPEDYAAEKLAAARINVAAIAGAAPIPDDIDVEITQQTIPMPDGEVGIYLYTPRRASSARPAVLHIHGGGFIVGSAEMTKSVMAIMADSAECVVVSVDYRLAPETPHPGPVEDCYAALKWLHASAAALGVDPTRIAVTGESAGGGLAASLALLARDRGEVPLVHQHLIYPMLDDRTCVADLNPHAGAYVWTADANRFAWAAFLGCAPGSTGVSPYAAAARAEDLAGLPNSFIMVGALDLFLEENLDYARRLIRAGIPTELHVYPGAYHAFEMIPDAAVSKAARRDALTALRRALHPGRTWDPE